MVSRDDGKYVIWPVYFDKNISRRDGRRVPKNIAVDKPSLDNMYRIAKEMGLNPEIEKEAKHPSKQWDYKGRILVDKKDKKEKILREIAKRLKSLS